MNSIQEIWATEYENIESQYSMEKNLHFLPLKVSGKDLYNATHGLWQIDREAIRSWKLSPTESLRKILYSRQSMIERYSRYKCTYTHTYIHTAWRENTQSKILTQKKSKKLLPVFSDQSEITSVDIASLVTSSLKLMLLEELVVVLGSAKLSTAVVSIFLFPKRSK